MENATDTYKILVAVFSDCSDLTDRNMAATLHKSLTKLFKEHLTHFLPNRPPFFMSCNGPTIASHSFGNLTGSERPK